MREHHNISRAIPLAIGLLLIGCARTPRPEPPRAVTHISRETVERFVEARRLSQQLRIGIATLARKGRGPFLSETQLSPALLSGLRERKRDYFRLREGLFDVAFFHASAIVERADASGLPALLLRTSLSVMAAADLVHDPLSGRDGETLYVRLLGERYRLAPR